MTYIVVTARVRYSNGYEAVECFTIPVDSYLMFERNIKIKSNGQMSVLEVIKVEPCVN